MSSGGRGQGFRLAQLPSTSLVRLIAILAAFFSFWLITGFFLLSLLLRFSLLTAVSPFSGVTKLEIYYQVQFSKLAHYMPSISLATTSCCLPLPLFIQSLRAIVLSCC